MERSLALPPPAAISTSGVRIRVGPQVILWRSLVNVCDAILSTEVFTHISEVDNNRIDRDVKVAVESIEERRICSFEIFLFDAREAIEHGGPAGKQRCLSLDRATV